MKRIAITAGRPGVRRALGWLTLLVIGLTIVPTGAQPADGGEFQLVARDLGVAHPPGYALYTMAAHLFGRAVVALPVSGRLGWPWAVNAFSMVLAVATLAVVARTAARLGGSWWAGAMAALILAASPTFAAQALVANIRMATALLTAVLLALVALWLDTDRDAARGSDAARIAAGADGTVRPPVRALGRALGGDRTLVALAFALALAAGHHPTLAALALPLGLAVVLRRPAVVRDVRLVAQCLGAALVGLLPLAYLPLRAAQGAPLAPPDLATAGGVWRHVTAAGFRGDMLALSGARDVGDRLGVLANILTLQFTVAALALATVGAVWLVARRRAAAVAVGGTFVVVAWLAMTYRAPQTMEYLLPAYVALAVAAGCGAAVVLRAMRGRRLPPPRAAEPSGARRPADLAALAAALALVVAVGYRAPHTAAARAAVPDLAAIAGLASDPACLSADATVLASWHFATPLWLAGRRAPDGGGAAGSAPYVTASGAPIVYVHPDFTTGDPIGLTWRKAAEAAVRHGPVLVTNRTAEVIDGDQALQGVAGTPFWRIGRAERRPGACAATATDFPGLTVAWLDDDGATWQLWGDGVEVTADGLDVRLLARAPGDVPSTGLSAFAQLVDADGGAVVGQADRPLGRVAVTLDSDGPPAYAVRLPLAPFRGAADVRRFALDVGLYRTTPDGPRRLRVDDVLFDILDSPRAAVPFLPPEGGEVIDGTAARLLVVEGATAAWLAAAAGPPVTASAIPFGGAMTLLSTAVRRTPTALVVDLAWRADARAFASDYTVSVQAAADDGAWRAQHDGTPALGAIPTLKWLPGMVIRDRHRLPLPPEAAGHDGPITVTVGVYDAFSLEPLPVTDAARVRAGEGQRATVYPSP